MRFYQTSWGWFFSFSFQERGTGFGIFKSDYIKVAKLLKLIAPPPENEIRFEDLPTNIKTIITASASCLVETAHTDIRELGKKEQK